MHKTFFKTQMMSAQNNDMYHKIAELPYGLPYKLVAKFILE